MTNRAFPVSPSLAPGRLWLPVLLSVALLAGGGSTNGAPLDGALAALGGVAILALVALHVTARRPLGAGASKAILLLVALGALVLVQLVAWPDAPWWDDPSRAGARWASEVAGARPAGYWSLDPDATLRFGLRWLLPVAVLLASLGADDAERRHGYVVLAACAALSAVLAIGQRADIGDWAFPFGRDDGGMGGVFANANHQASLLACGAIAARLVLNRNGALALLCALFLLGAIASQSRAAMLLVPVTIALLFLLPAARGSKARGLRAASLSVAALAVVAGAIAAWRWGLGAGPTDRTEIWTNAFALGQDASPWGVGFGAFARVFRSVQPLETLTPYFVNETHFELLQWWVEGGIVGLILLLVTALLVGRGLVRAQPIEPYRRERLAAAGILAVLLVHGLVDYPTRTVALGSLGLMSAGWIAFGAPGEAGRASRWAPIALGLLALAGLWAQVNERPFRAQAIATGDTDRAALAAAPDSGDVRAKRASQALVSAPRRAMAEARASLARSPLQPEALRVVMLADDEPLASHRWHDLARVGWRDRPSQAAAMVHAIRAGEPERAGRHAAALDLLKALSPDVTNWLQEQAQDPAFREAYLTPLPHGRPASLIAYPGAMSPQALEGARLLLEERGEAASDAEYGTVLRHLVEAKRSREAQLLFRARWPDTAPFDNSRRTGFSGGAGPTPFDWSFARSDAIRVSLDGSSLVIANDGTGSGRVARRLLAVGPGDYRLSADVDASRPGGRVKMTVVCADSDTILRQAEAENGGSIALTFATSSQCPVAAVEIAISPSDRRTRTRLENWRLSAI